MQRLQEIIRRNKPYKKDWNHRILGILAAFLKKKWKSALIGNSENSENFYQNIKIILLPDLSLYFAHFVYYFCCFIFIIMKKQIIICSLLHNKYLKLSSSKYSHVGHIMSTKGKKKWKTINPNVKCKIQKSTCRHSKDFNFLLKVWLDRSLFFSTIFLFWISKGVPWGNISSD